MYVSLGFVKGRDLDEALQESDAASNVLLSKLKLSILIQLY